MDPYKFNSWIRILICLCSMGAYLLIALMLPLFVAVPNFETRFGIFFVSPYNDNKYISWYKFEGHICSKVGTEKKKKRKHIYYTFSIALSSPYERPPIRATHFTRQVSFVTHRVNGHILYCVMALQTFQLLEETSKTKNYAKETRLTLCDSINFLKYYFLIVFIITGINLMIVMGMLIYTHFREHPETFPLKHVHFCNKLIILITCLSIFNIVLFAIPFFFFNTHMEFGKRHYLHAGFYILMADFLSHFLIIIFVKRDKTILKCVCELELLPWEKKQKLHVHNADYNDTLISPAELTNYLQAMFQQEHITEDQLKNFFGTDNYEQIYYIIMNNVKAQKQMANMYP
ncbi:conserved Plasmodium protein, unknown function [Plasmodium knowlesi strain H]|uniref:Uncharacterized protein n=1 Tax=Plasmodium knowlesi (strain H) TaxID=5851 RepID=A0A193QTI3_PLAKH|nr:conserved Plasmodium protein, unknown function [Plasmodium knowlesi strain H]SBO24190.1 conserved Plasmodium protein, unknown function [Plasmodium knowlesi strain H]